MITIRRVLASALALFGLSVVSFPASASHSSPAMIAVQIDGPPQSCVQEWYGGIINNCPTERRVALPVHNYWGGTQTAEINVIAPSSSQTVGCQLIGQENGWLVGISPQVFPSVYGAAATTLKVSANVTSRSGNYVLCTLSPGARINHLWFSGS